jgi:hypothetical protein
MWRNIDMKQHALKIFAGASNVKQMKDKLIQAGINVICFDDENIFVNHQGKCATSAGTSVLNALTKAHASHFNLEPQPF